MAAPTGGATDTCPPWRSLAGKVVMVTGASSGIGRELCLDLARAGCFIVAAARRTDKLDELCDEINGRSSPTSAMVLDRGIQSVGSFGVHLNATSASIGRGLERTEELNELREQISGWRSSTSAVGYSDREVRAVRSVGVQLDVSADEAAIEASVKRAWDAFGRIDALVNNAGIRGEVYGTLDWPEREWNRLMGTNLTGLWLVTKHVCHLMRDATVKGAVINISSIAGIDRGQLPGGIAYAASKAGVTSITKVMAMELGKFNIRVNSIAPGLFPSEITNGLVKKSWLQRVCERTVPLKTFGTIDPALTSLARYLIHDSSGYVSGNIFIVDAGVTLPGVPIFSSL